ncbi:MAG TPA: carboxypeptidase regulatory-like domain-containing protein [Flavisolibacter sp.]|nr:carboxypeptidase regulatory-like domain-containing protein [Flavisolibacter sp.]
MRILLTALSFLFFSSIQAQSLQLSGKVVNEKNEPVAGVTIQVTGDGGTATNVGGNFSVTISPGKKYELRFSAIGYESKTISDVEVISGEVNELNIVLQSTSKDMSNVVITANRTSARRESANSMIAFQKNTNTVAQVISAEAIRRSPDKNTGEVLKRIPGASIQEGKYLIVRGLADRYNQAMLNGIQLSSTEPDRKTFSFDIFPAPMIDNIVINKAFVPEMTGEWAGGLVQINTKDIPAQPFFTLQVGTGFNSQTIGKDFYTAKGGKLDWLGIDDNTRALPSDIPFKYSFKDLSPSEKTEWGKKFNNGWSTTKGNVPLNASLQASGGFSTKLFGKKLGSMLALTYSGSSRNLQFDNNIYTLDRTAKTADSSYAYHNNRYSREVLWGALANFALELNRNNKISIKNIFNINANDYITLRTGKDYEFGVGGTPIKAQEIAFKSNTLFNTQVTGEHHLGKLKSKLKWYGNFTILDQYIPDQKRLQYNLDANGAYEALLGQARSQKSGSVFYSNLSDYIYTAGGDWTTNFRLFDLGQTVKAGYLLQVKDRIYNARPFSMVVSETADLNKINQLRHLSPDQIFASENFGSNGFLFDEYSEPSFRYMANSILNAGYLQFDNQFAKWLRVVWGARVEDFDQVTGSVKQSDPRHLHTRVTDILPALNATFKLNNNTNIRLAGSQTVIRPEFRELSNLAFFDFELGATVVGNMNLKRTKVSNLDLRYELYPRPGEMFTAGVFFKHFKDPIEQLYNQTGTGGSSTFNFLNADKATDYGAEIELRKKLDFASALKNFTFQTNLSYIFSKVESEGNKLDRPLQGQSPYVINFALQYDLEKIGLSTTALFNQIGRRILYVGNDQVPETWEAPRPLLDLQIAKKLIKGRGEVKLNVADIINRKAYFYHDVNEDKKFTNHSKNDALALRRNYGTNYNISFSYNF